MSQNPYAAPEARVDEPRSSADEAPPLWNPNAAANWSLLFTPVFGAYLHMRNWQALGRAKEAMYARFWMLGYFVVSVGIVLFVTLGNLPANGPRPSNMIWLLYLIVWYVVGARPQVRFVSERYGKTYPRRGWLVPILVAIACFVVWFMMLAGAFLLVMRVM